jgi:hypothetical protein
VLSEMVIDSGASKHIPLRFWILLPMAIKKVPG